MASPSRAACAKGATCLPCAPSAAASRSSSRSPTSPPWMLLPRAPCNRCFRPPCFSPLKRCSACKAVFYCFADCQRREWRWHKFECGILVRLWRKKQRTPTSTMRLLLRLLIKQKLQADQISISYVELAASTTTRRKSLKDQYYFDYNCIRCSRTAQLRMLFLRGIDVLPQTAMDPGLQSLDVKRFPAMRADANVMCKRPRLLP